MYVSSIPVSYYSYYCACIVDRWELFIEWDKYSIIILMLSLFICPKYVVVVVVCLLGLKLYGKDFHMIQKRVINYSLPSIKYSLPSINYSLPSINYSLPSIN